MFQHLSFAHDKKKVDSLQAVLKTAPADTHKVTILNQLAEELQTDDPDKAIQYASEQAALSEKLSFSKGTAQAYKIIAWAHTNKGEYDLAIENNLKALKINERLADKKAISSVYTTLGAVYYYMNKHDKALAYWQQSLDIDKELHDTLGIAKVMNNIGVALEKLGRNNEALINFEQALKISQVTENKNNIANNLNNIGNIYDDLKDYNKALGYYKQSLIIEIEIGDRKETANTYLNIALSYFRQKNYDLALEYIDKGFSVARAILNRGFMKEAYVQYADVYSATKKFEKAYEYRGLASEMQDSLLNAQMTEQIADMDAKYQTDKKEQQIVLLNKDKVLQDVQLNRQKIVIWSSAGGIFLLLLLSFFIFRGYRQKQRANTLLAEKNILIEQQKEIVEEKNKDITDSINYAKRIQRAILAREEEITKVFPESFLLYKPKDIVAGDFYFFETTPTHIFYAACDCTGHGVPGALVSVVCSNALSRAVKEFGISDTGKILDKVTELILETFEKSSEEVKDGMDISLLAIHKSTKQLTWSGANNPLWYIQNSELIAITANKQPIGKYDNRKPFTTHSIAYQPDTAFYLFTDGYADQFGGPKGKKFKYLQMQNLLMSIQDKKMQQQEEILLKTINDWKGKLEQVDDILVIGVKM